ncbi:MAG: ribonuclease E/G [Qingshengfaniella sp.]
MTFSVVTDHIGGRPSAALLCDGVLDDLLIDPPGQFPRQGTIYRALADRPVKGQGGIFVRLPEGSGFLRHAKGITPGRTLLVQVTGYAEPGKAVPVSARPLFKSRYCIVSPGAPGANLSRAIRDEDERLRLRDLLTGLALPEGTGLILRSACTGTEAAPIVADINAMLDVARAVTGDAGSGPELLLDGPNATERAWMEWPEASPPVPDADFGNTGVAEAIAALAGPAPLPGGGQIHVEPTHALIAVDINTGPDTSPAAGLKANLAAARLLPRLLRLRGLGGQITVDLAPAPKKDRPRIEQAFRAAFRGDRIETALAGWTPLGNLELQRKRERLPLSIALTRK